jgi:ubiquinone biosynthesis protein UbiJ
MEIELSEMLGRKVDLRTAQDLSRYFRGEVLAQAEVQYACRVSKANYIASGRALDDNL